MSTPNIHSFVEDIKSAGITIDNEQQFVTLMSNADDQGLMLSRVLRDRRNDIDFRRTRHFSDEGLALAFKNQGFDGFAWKEFVDHMKSE
ncbi:hypothetical protein [Pseudomonas taiwanensis]|uniref:hypothetical protein n=1 Tax=Pseudomonas TaxID=286 RepID=UPI0028DFCE49|nr:hypothetical protein [Pseudomonas taiwanensis]MDT8925407.1 hypothetical protein [Pseudomonas taiwanensis]